MAARKAAGDRSGHRDAHLWLLARHDFRQPVQALELLAKGIAHARTDDERARYSIAVAQTASMLGEMVSALSLAARLDIGEIRPAPVSLSLTQAFAEAVAATGGAYLSSPPRLPLQPAVSPVSADVALLAVVLRGALLYAAKHCEQDDIAADAANRGDRVALRLSFAGVHQEHAMVDGAFIDLPPAESDARTPFVGMAPALIKRVLRHMDGEIALETTPDRRASIVIVLPGAG